MHIDFNKENNKEAPEFKVGGNVRISKYKNIFVKGYVLNWSENVSVIKKVKGALSDQRQFLAAGSPSKMMKNAFCFTSKALFFLKIFNFCLDFLVM